MDLEPDHIELEQITYFNPKKLKQKPRTARTASADEFGLPQTGQIHLASVSPAAAKTKVKKPFPKKAVAWTSGILLAIGGCCTAMVHDDNKREAEANSKWQAYSQTKREIYSVLDTQEGNQAFAAAIRPAFVDYCKTVAETSYGKDIYHDSDMDEAGCGNALKGKPITVSDVKAVMAIAGKEFSTGSPKEDGLVEGNKKLAQVLGQAARNQTMQLRR